MKYLLLVLLLSGCGIPDELEQDEFKPKSSCSFDKIFLEAEFKVDCDVAWHNLATAMDITGFEPDNLHIQIWDRSILQCDNYFLGICTYWIKGLAWRENGEQMIALNKGGEALAHEMFHHKEWFTETNDDPHYHWESKGFYKLDRWYRLFHIPFDKDR